MSQFVADSESLDVLSAVPEDAKAIGTHDGTFHCDEALAIAMLKCLPEFKDHVIVRTRNPDELAKCHIVVDVGAEYDAERLRFDHHQKTFDGVLEGYSTKLSSAGLIYKHYGRSIIETVSEGKFPQEILGDIYKKVYEGFVEAVDGVDNGVEAWGPAAEGDPAPARRYRVTTDLSARVGRLNPQWNEPYTAEALGERFKAAVALTGAEFAETVLGLADGWWPARALVQEAMEARAAVHPSGEIVKFTSFAPWKSHLFDLERAAGTEGQVKYVLYPDGSSGKWRIQAVSVAEQSFQSRLALPEAWRGVRDAELSAVSGVPGGVFVHASGFIGGNETEDGVLQMAIKALEMGGK